MEVLHRQRPASCREIDGGKRGAAINSRPPVSYYIFLRFYNTRFGFVPHANLPCLPRREEITGIMGTVCGMNIRPIGWRIWWRFFFRCNAFYGTRRKMRAVSLQQYRANFFRCSGLANRRRPLSTKSWKVPRQNYAVVLNFSAIQTLTSACRVTPRRCACLSSPSTTQAGKSIFTRLP